MPRKVRRNHVRVTFGRKGSGKSYSIKRRIERTRGPVCVWDTLAEYAGEASAEPVKGAVLYRSVRDLAIASSEGTLARCAVVRGKREEFDAWCRWAIAAGPRLLVIDEVNLYCGPARGSAPLLELLRIGRHSCIDIEFAARRPAEVHRDLTAQADALVFFKTTEPNDLEWVRRYCGSEFASRLPSLRKYASASFTA